MSGRALAARPWMMWQLGEKLNFDAPLIFQNKKAPNTPEEEGVEFGRALLKLIDYSEEEFMQNAGAAESLTLRKIQFHIRTTQVWLQFGHSLMANASKCKNLNELRICVVNFFSTEQKMNLKTELRQ